MTSFGVLGPLEAFRDADPVPLRGPRHRTVLARLLIARGRVVPIDVLADDVWSGAPPPGAVAALRTFVADLRRALEPGRPPRTPSRLLITTPPGYALAATPSAVDAWRFESLATPSAAPSLAAMETALAMWRGPAYAEWTDEGWARSEIDRLEDLRILTIERRAAALLDLDRAAEAAADLRAHATEHPLRESAWRLLALALYRADRQADALAALREARATLAAELGLDLSPTLRTLESDILTQAARLDAAQAPVPRPGASPPRSPRSSASSPDSGPEAPVPGRSPLTPSSIASLADISDISEMSEMSGSAKAVRGAGQGWTGGAERPALFGREDELAALRGAAAGARRSGRPVVALVTGEAGAGKTALAEALAAELGAAGWTVAWGRAAEHEGAWPWTQMATALRGGVEPAGRFGLHHAAARLVAEVAAQGPVALVADDLHWADEDTLELLTYVVSAVAGPVLLLGTARDVESTPQLTAALARLARMEPIRVYLRGLNETATAELARAAAGRDLGPAALATLHRRGGGNPFFTRELARLVAAEGEEALSSVPPGVRDVIRHRLDRLSAPARDVLRRASVLGRDVDPELLAELHGGPVLEELDEAIAAGFLPDGRRFAHVLVRDTVYGDLSAPRRSAWHAAAGEALQRLSPDDADALAHHFTAAATRATAPRAAHYSAVAAERAERRANPHEAARLWRQALSALDRAANTSPTATANTSPTRAANAALTRAAVRGPAARGGDRPQERLAAMIGLGRALAVVGKLDEARELRAQGLAAAERLGDVESVAEVLGAFDVPAIWPKNDDERLSAELAAAATRTLDRLPGAPPALRARLLAVLALEQRGARDDRGARAAAEAERLARAEADPALLALALNARFLHAFERAGLAPRRAALGAELVDLAARHDLVTFEVLGHLIGLQAACALDDRPAADAHAEAADRLAERFALPMVGVFTQWYSALRLAADGRHDAAESAYRAADARLATAAMPGVREGLLGLALLSVDRYTPGDDLGPYEPWARPLLLLRADRRPEAAAALRALPPSPRDLLLEARLCLAAKAARTLGDRETAARIAEELRPAATEHAAGSGVLTLGPVSAYL
ncbi:BTAD domain-containing putative transcriptional regulator [Dactylosporangium sp. CA-092794]|uniref:BTAD domain-containing putative transcriptional regulator n=1 Tax=Dactylosporangium sp. CA-092794 TaxID=3239929 RepID=UPI003D8AD932